MLNEYSIGKIILERFESEEPYSGLRATIQMKHMFASEVTTAYPKFINFLDFTDS